MTREELIAELERAEGPSRELDAAIAAHVGETVMPFQLDEHAWMCKDGKGGWMPITRPGSRPHTTNDRYVPRYTASLDAALTLVPEGWRWSLDWTQRPPYQDCGRANLYAPGNGIEPPDVCDVYGATPALALCIAALKARA